MKRNLFIVSLLVSFFCSCGAQPASEINVATQKKAAVPTAIISVDDKKYVLTDADIAALSFVNNSYLGLSLMSEKNDLQFMFSAFVPELKPGTYQVSVCKEASDCAMDADDKNQRAFYAPYPKDPMPPVSTSRTAYGSKKLGLQPLTLVLTDVLDEQQAGMPVKTKRVKGTFSGTLAYVEKQGDDWKIVGNTTKVEGAFDLYCTIR